MRLRYCHRYQAAEQVACRRGLMATRAGNRWSRSRAEVNPENLPYLTESEPDLTQLISAAATAHDGAICTFQGTARTTSGADSPQPSAAVAGLHYEAYESMATTVIVDIAARVEAAFPGTRVVVQHRVGACPLGEAAVAVVAVAPHRDEAFKACRQVIDTLKRDAPIWKKEIFQDGSQWIGERP